MKARIGLCQIKTVESPEENLRAAERALRLAAESGCQLAVLPEMFCCPYSNESFRANAQEAKEGGAVYDFLSGEAKRLGMAIVGGSMPEREGDSIYNSSLIFDERGRLAGKHRKVHLFDVDIKDGIRFMESETISAGDSATVARVAGISVGVGICYDVRFPILASVMAEGGAELLAYPGAFNMVTGPAHWEMTLKARALDSQCFAVGVSPALNEGLSYRAYGHSMAADPWGRTMLILGYEENFAAVDIDLEMLHETRRQLPLLAGARKVGLAPTAGGL